jgi:hypothetical protein
MAYTTINKPSEHFNTVTYAGNSSSTQSITGVNFQPDFVWIKQRNLAYSHILFDAIRGVGKSLQSNAPAVDETNSSIGYLSAFDSDGFTVSQGSSGGDRVNGAYNYVSWNWLANGAGVSNTDGDVTATVSANQTSGFSIVKYVNPASGSPFTVGHGLGSAPKMIIIKNTSGVQNWGVWHTSIGFGNYLILNTTAATGAANLVTATSATTFSTYQDHHSTGVDLIAYCFAEKKGFSKFGSYVGNGNADGTFVYTGFKPAFVLFKPSSATENWQIHDNKRPSYNPCDNIAPNNSSAEADNDFVDLVSNGFKLRSATYSASGVTYIYMAFAENPLVGTNNIPATAR